MVQRSTRQRIPRLRRRARPTGPVIDPPTQIDGPGEDGRSRPIDPQDPDDLDGGAGVREPRRPGPTMPAATVAREIVHPSELDLTADRR